MSVLVTGGAGYIGSHMVYGLLDRGEQVCVLDNLSTGIRDLVPHEAHFFHGHVNNRNLVQWILAHRDVDAVVHFAGSAVVPDSVNDPLAYYRNNTAGSLELLDACVAGGVKHFIFSSTAAVYGACEGRCIDESNSPAPINPYGRSKLMTEWMLQDVAPASDMRFTVLRYFNVAGADPGGRTGQSTPRATHLIKRACQVALGLAAHLDIYGCDFPTPDGTGVRDYIHVADLVEAHGLALDALRSGEASTTLNCGYGRGFSVRQVVEAVERATGRRLPIRIQARRPGDPAAVVADSSRLRSELGWRPRYDNLDEIVRHALDWEARAGVVPRITPIRTPINSLQIAGDYV
ncbi:MAG: UDP-glucose 4-epimerase GalE [Caulobacteraceae bacterium]|nr:UDP-glucose 4-epimerase GalE [Caulobacteraceae bacterium]